MDSQPSTFSIIMHDRLSFYIVLALVGLAGVIAFPDTHFVPAIVGAGIGGGLARIGFNRPAITHQARVIGAVFLITTAVASLATFMTHA